MGVIEVEIKTLRGDRPVVFAWDNPVKKVMQCVLVTCPCQSIAFPETKSLPQNPDGTVMCDRNLAFDLAAAMDKADLITHSSLDNMESLLNRVKRAEFEESEAKERTERAKKDRRNKMRKERRRKQAMEKTTAQKNVEGQNLEECTMEIDDVQNRLGQLLEETKNGIPGSLPVEDQSSLLFSSSTLPGEQHVVKDYVEIVGFDEANAYESLSSDNFKATGCGEATDPGTIDGFVEGGDRVKNVEEVSSAVSIEEPAVDEKLISNSFKATGCETTERGSIDNLVESVALKDVKVISSAASATSVTPSSVAEDDDDTEGLMEAIQSIFTEYPDAKDGLPQGPSTLNRESGNQLPVEEGREKVRFIRHLTEEERLKMFRLRSDTERENRKKLEQAKAFLCDICGKIVTLRGTKKHIETHEATERKHVCNICGKAFITSHRLRSHVKTHDANRKFTCRYCPSSYRTFTGRTNHERRHFAVYPEECKLCDQHFIDRKSYKRHLHRIHGLEMYKEKSSNKPSGGRQSGRKDKPKRPIETAPCKVCNKLISKPNMKGHMYKHEGRMYTCNICGKVMAFSTKYVHRKLHSKESQACAVCGKRVLNMNVHMRIHTGEKPFKCRYCDKKFSTQGTRQVHEVMHTGERPYKCTICDKSWRDRNCYKIHMQKLHPGEPIYYKRRSAQINISRRGTLAITPVPSVGTVAEQS